MSRPSGFSLVELVVTLIIAGILAALAIPRFTDTESKATWFHEQVKAAVRYAQRQAVAQHRSIYVLVQSTTVDLCYDATCSTSAMRLAQPGTNTSYTLNAPSGATISATTTPFSFDALGRPSPITGVTLTVAGRSISVTAETGYVYVP